MRVVSLTCSNTEIVAALGAGDLLVGIDDHSDYPEALVAELPRVGRDLNIEIEKVAALAPDLVLASLTVPGHEEVVAGLEAAGLPYIAPEPVSLADVYRDIRDIATRLDRADRGEALVQAMQGEIPDTTRFPQPAAPHILVEWWPKPVIVPGARSWVADLIHAAGGYSPLQEDVKSRAVEDADLPTLRPDAVVISWCGVDFANYRPDEVYKRKPWQGLPALQHRRVHCVPEAYLGRPGPRLVDGYRALRRVVEDVQRSN